MTMRFSSKARWGGGAFLTAALFISGLFPPGFADSARAEPEERKVTFNSAILPRATDMTVNGQASRAVVRAFLQKYPQYHVEPFIMPAITGAAMDSAPLMGIAAGNPPHAIYVNFRQSSTYINHGFLDPLEILLARVQSENPRVREADADGNWLADPTQEEIDYWRDRILERIPEPVRPVLYRKAGVNKEGIPTGKHIWSIPTGISVRALAYRKDVFQEAGLDPERPPETWDEFLDYARRIQAVDNRQGMMISGGTVISWFLYGFMVADGGRYVAEGEDGRWRAAFNTRETAEAIHFMTRLVSEPFDVDGVTHYGAARIATTADDRMLWSRGQVGMTFLYLRDEMMGDLNPEVTGIAPIPLSPRGNRAGELNAPMVGVFSQTTPEQKIGLMRYIWFTVGDEAQQIRAEIFVNNGYGRFLNPEILERLGYDDVLRRVPPGWRETYETAMETGVPEPYGQNTQFIYEEVSTPINWAFRQPLLQLPEETAIERIMEQLDMAAGRVDRFMLGELTPEEWRQRRLVGGTMLFIVLTIFVGCITYIWRAFKKQELEAGDRPPLRRFLKAYAMLTPALAIVIFWQYIPKILGLPLALFDYELVVQSTWVGIDNFATALYDPRFWRSLWNTFYYVILVVGLGFWPPIMTAVLLDEVPTDTLKYFFRTIFYLPMIVSGVIMVFLWLQLYDPSASGYLNQILLLFNRLGPVGGTIVKLVLLGTWLGLILILFAVAAHLKELSWPVRTAVFVFALALLGATLWPVVKAWRGPDALVIEALQLAPEEVSGLSGVLGFLGGLVGRFNITPLRWVHDPGMAMLAVVIPGVWAASGPGCIIYLAALKTVPTELVEASTMDGASLLQKLAYITLPRVKFLILIQLVGSIVAAFQGGTNFILAMTGGGPEGATRVLGLDIFQRSFMELQYGLGAAMSWLLGAIVMVLTAFQLRRMSRAEFRTAKT